MAYYTNINSDHGASHGVYQGSNTDTPLMTGSFEECTAWCRSNGWRWAKNTKTWDAGIQPQRARHRVERINR